MAQPDPHSHHSALLLIERRRNKQDAQDTTTFKHLVERNTVLKLKNFYSFSVWMYEAGSSRTRRTQDDVNDFRYPETSKKFHVLRSFVCVTIININMT